ncbi:MAG TPA: DUF2130 domain-containing protein [Deltaproteobacteria bacterium]|nr:MAG: hypothetical protein A2Z79_13085 [Deltaproteobacteria bacterium GWA2_55_82]OGQ62808.1 MAG: hypothetical protein A3I81_11865 [Deltaproteobacteria bacterium RIFCSPLOWO2_02_FULL_55_12]OIJ73528.1 MAG: hypothetical protein A2V21_304155 [Deltaproteobacteria bacterium GWC2_55_46]HBG46260.1 DUF2130 domain-containing protein [Deltaproteobacteria bacterium]HCY10167.1 DUF2130 domain-containing protein [Deltaproteobacteria bacterium]
MADQTIRCPNCGSKIPLTEAFSNQIKEGLRAEYEAKARQKDLEIGAREEEIQKKLADIEASKKAVEETVARKLSVERSRLADEARKKALEQVATELNDLKEERIRKDALLEEARGQELELRRRARVLEEEKKALDLKVAREIDAEREQIRQATLEMFSEEHRLKDMEKDKKISDMLRHIEELKRKGEQGSMQTQGEVAELDLEALLRSKFPVDVVEPVPKGMRGADIVQKVYTRAGQYCGSIVWESKRTKAWSDEWVSKLKDDQREMKAEVAVLVSEALPRGVAAFAQFEGVWVTGASLAGSLAEALRAGLIDLAISRLSAVGKNEKMESIYNYLSGQEFRQRIEGIVESFSALREDLEAEKRAMLKIWARREKQLERVLNNTAGMYGDMQGIIGTTLPEIKMLELGVGPEEDI